MTRKPWDHGGKSSAERGYGAAWRKIRARVLDEQPTCQVCAARGKVTLATAVDHIKPKARGGTDARYNLRSICDPCHKAKTAEDQGRTLQTRPVTGEDGWPVGR